MDFLNKAKDLLQDDNKSQQQTQQPQQGGQSCESKAPRSYPAITT